MNSRFSIYSLPFIHFSLFHFLFLIIILLVFFSTNSNSSCIKIPLTILDTNEYPIISSSSSPLNSLRIPSIGNNGNGGGILEIEISTDSNGELSFQWNKLNYSNSPELTELYRNINNNNTNTNISENTTNNANSSYLSFNSGGDNGTSLVNKGVSLENSYNRLYTGELSFGTPSQLFRLVFDTGSADLWIFSNDHRDQLPYLRYFNKEKSSTYKKLENSHFSIKYGKGNVSGRLGRDKISILNYTLNSFEFGEILESSNEFRDPNLLLDGILGLGFSKISRGTENLMDSLKLNQLINEKIFTFRLEPTMNRIGSFFIFGMPKKSDLLLIDDDQQLETNVDNYNHRNNNNNQLYSNGINDNNANTADNDNDINISYREKQINQYKTKSVEPDSSNNNNNNNNNSTHLNSSLISFPHHSLTSSSDTDLDIIWMNLFAGGGSGMWISDLEQFKINGKSQEFCDSSYTSSAPAICIALFDTGTSFIAIPSNRYSNLVEQIITNRPDCSLSTHSYIITCSLHYHYHNLPTISFQFDGWEFHLSPRDYLIGGSTIGIMPIDISSIHSSSQISFIILGDTFLKSFPTIYDMENKRIGIVKTKKVKKSNRNNNNDNDDNSNSANQHLLNIQWIFLGIPLLLFTLVSLCIC